MTPQSATESQEANNRGVDEVFADHDGWLSGVNRPAHLAVAQCATPPAASPATTLPPWP